MGDESDGLLREILTTVKVIAEGQVELRKDVSSLQKGQDSLQKDVSSLQKGLDELRRVTSVNHYKTIGRIEGLESMLAMHMTDHGHYHDPLGLYPAKTTAGD